MNIVFETNKARQDRAARDQIKGRDQAWSNAKEWLRRAEEAGRAGDYALAANLTEQALLELKPYR